MCRRALARGGGRQRDHRRPSLRRCAGEHGEQRDRDRGPQHGPQHRGVLMATRATPVPPQGASAGTRGVLVTGNVSNSVIVTGDDVNVELKIGPENGAIVEELARFVRPRTRKLRPPVRTHPSRPKNHIDRSRETEHALADDAARVINYHAAAGVGKTYLLCNIANNPRTSEFPDGVVYLFGRDKRQDDLLQELFDAFYESSPPARRSTTEISRRLNTRQALILVDAAEQDPDELLALTSAVPQCRFIVATRDAVSIEGETIALGGLELPEALAIVEQELRRPLTPEEHAAAETISVRLGGHPLKIREL